MAFPGRRSPRTQATRGVHPESRELTPEEEQAVVQWVEKQDT